MTETLTQPVDPIETSSQSAGFSLPDDEAAALQDAAQKKKRAQQQIDFLELLAAYYDVKQNSFKRAHRPLLAQFTLATGAAVPNSTDEPLVVQMPGGSNLPIAVRLDSVTTEAPLTMEAALEMALLAKANPNMQDGVELTGTPEEQALLLAAAKQVGLKILNAPAIEKPVMKALQAQAKATWKTLGSRNGVALEDEPENSAEQTAGSNEYPFEGETKEKVMNYFAKFRELEPSFPEMPEEEVKKMWEQTPAQKRKEFMDQYDAQLAQLEEEIQKAKAGAKSVAPEATETTDITETQKKTEASTPAPEVVPAQPSRLDPDLSHDLSERTGSSPEFTEAAVGPLTPERQRAVAEEVKSKTPEATPAPVAASQAAPAFNAAARNVLTDPTPADVLAVLQQDEISEDFYLAVKKKIVESQQVSRRRVEDIIGIDLAKTGASKLAGAILKAMEAEGVVKLEGANKRVVVADRDGTLPAAPTP